MKIFFFITWIYSRVRLLFWLKYFLWFFFFLSVGKKNIYKCTKTTLEASARSKGFISGRGKATVRRVSDEEEPKRAKKSAHWFASLRVWHSFRFHVVLSLKLFILPIKIAWGWQALNWFSSSCKASKESVSQVTWI